METILYKREGTSFEDKFQVRVLMQSTTFSKYSKLNRVKKWTCQVEDLNFLSKCQVAPSNGT